MHNERSFSKVFYLKNCWSVVALGCVATVVQSPLSIFYDTKNMIKVTKHERLGSHLTHSIIFSSLFFSGDLRPQRRFHPLLKKIFQFCFFS